MRWPDAARLWGSEVVATALAESEPAPLDPVLSAEIKEKANSGTDVSFAWWALQLSWPKFCSVVRLVSGETLRELLEEHGDDT